MPDSLVFMAIPGLNYGGYVRLGDIVSNTTLADKKILFEFKSNLVYANGKVLQGLVIIGEYAQITGNHYTSWENATQIRSTGRIEPSLDDPFVYLSEPGKMNDWPEHLIKKETGAIFADTQVKLTLVVPINLVWIKASREVVHYSVSGIVAAAEIKDIVIQRRKPR